MKPGYKKTDVGIIPEDWRYLPITKIARLESGHTPSKRRMDYWGGSINWISLFDTQGLSKNEITNTEKTITEEGLNNSSARLLPAGTVVFSRTATVGKTSIMASPMATSQDFANYVCGPDLHNLFLVYLFRSMGRSWKMLMAGSIHNTIYMPTFKALKILVPPLPEQKSIAEALSDTDVLIESLERLLTKKRQIKQGMMQELLTGQRRLSGFSGEWIKKSLGECLLASPDYGINASAVTYSDRLPAYVRITDITEDGRFAPAPLVSVAHPSAEKYYLNEGDLVFARTGASVGKSYLYKASDGALVFAGFLIRVRIDAAILEPMFLSYFVQTSAYWDWVKLMSMRSGQPGINGKEFSRLPLKIPSVTEQFAISSLLSEMESEAIAIETKLQKARHLKQGMMQELLTGRIRLV